MQNGQGPHIVIVAGEASGDLHGAHLVRALKQEVPDLTFSGIGGAAMQAEGVELVYHARDLALMGFSEVIKKLGHVLGILKGMKSHLARRKPDLLILIDFPDFNFRLGKAAKKMGIKVLYYVCPQVWAWRRGRASDMAGWVDLLAVVFPFEREFMTDLAPSLNTVFVGHPLLDHPPEPEDGKPPAPLPVDPDRPLVGILPGSREGEVSRILPCMFETARLMQKQRPDLQFVLPLAPGLEQEVIEPYMDQAPKGLVVLHGQAGQVMRQSRVLMVTSGTATLETALAGSPFLVVYKTSWFNFWVARALIKVEHIAMPNLIAGKKLVPEFIQHFAKPEDMAQTALGLLEDGPERASMLQGLAEVKNRMGGPGASRKVAELAHKLILENP